MARHELPLDPAFLHGHFSRDLEPVLTLDPGDSVRISVPNSGWRRDRDEVVTPLRPDVDTGHALAGPIEVRGVTAGQVLAVAIDEVVPGPWGATFTSPPHRIDWELEANVGRARGKDDSAGPVPGRARDAA